MVHLLAIDNHTDRRHYLGKTYSVHPSTTDIVILRVTLLNPSKHDDTLCIYSKATYTRYVVSKGKILAEYDGSSGTSRQFAFIYAGNQRIAMIDSEGKLHFYLNDHLGSARMVIDTAGTVKDSYDYYAFGEALDQTISTGQSYRYTGKPFDDDHSLNLHYYGARYYDATTGRFISVDPKASKYPAWSSYAYTLDNPMKHADPNGEDTYLVLYGSGALNPSLRGAHGDQGNNFRDAANTRADEIRSSKSFNEKTDAALVFETDAKAKFVEAVNGKYESGQIASIDVFSHGYRAQNFDSGGLNLGGTPDYESRLITEGVVDRELKPDLKDGATISLNACNTANKSSEFAPSIAQAFANHFRNATVTGYTGYTKFTSRKPPNHMIPQTGQKVVVPAEPAEKDE